MRTTIIIPNMNGEAYLKKLLPSLTKQTDHDFDVILVDNGSEDESVAYAMNYGEALNLTSICYDTNYGFSKAVNDGIRAASGEYILLLNNDTVAGHHLVEKLVQTMESDPKIFAAQALMLQYNDHRKVDSAGDYFSAMGWAFAGGKDRPAAAYRSVREVFSCCAGAAMYRKSLLDEVGLFDESFFAYLEDVDLGYRARLRGYKNVLVPQAKVLHVGSATSGSRHNAFKVEKAARNSVYVCYKNMSTSQLLMNALPMAGGALIKMGYFLPKGLTPAYIKGLKEGITHVAGRDKPDLHAVDADTLRQIEKELGVNVFRRLWEG